MLLVDGFIIFFILILESSLSTCKKSAVAVLTLPLDCILFLCSIEFPAVLCSNTLYGLAAWVPQAVPDSQVCSMCTLGACPAMKVPNDALPRTDPLVGGV